MAARTRPCQRCNSLIPVERRETVSLVLDPIEPHLPRNTSRCHLADHGQSPTITSNFRCQKAFASDRTAARLED